MTSATVVPGELFQKVYASIIDVNDNLIKFSRMRENLVGSSGTGSSGDLDRQYTLTTMNDVDIVEVFLDGVLLIETSQYTIDNANRRVTMVGTPVWNSQTIVVFYNV